ncbi:MAG: glycosyltransferase [Kiritimatiellae bacterium]|nr:glycosyltransferase [Kiritimatiellia bacterium]
MKILLSAFAFSPYRGSECAVGWNIARNLARFHDVTVIAGDLGDGENDYARYVAENGSVPRLTVDYVPPSRFTVFLERLHRLPGLWGLYYLAYNLWQRKACKRAKELLKTEKFDLVHQLTMIGYREPGYMWKLGLPFFWGPVGGAPNEPIAFRRMFSWRGCVKVVLRTVLNEIQKRICLRAKRAARKASKIWVVTDADYRMVHDLWGVECDRMVEAGRDDSIAGKIRSYDGASPLRIVWSGIHTSRKALPILLHALSRLEEGMEVGVDVLGEGPETAKWKSLAASLGVSSRLTWHGRLPRMDALKLMARAHVLACPSIKEASSIVVIEALSLGLPVICHDACGMGIVVTDKCGFKIPLRNPETSISGFATAIRTILERPDLVEQKSAAAIARVGELTWHSKVSAFSAAYLERREAK